MVIARGVRTVEIWYLDPDDAKQQLVIEEGKGRYEIADGVLRVYLADRTLIVPVPRVVLVDERLG